MTNARGAAFSTPGEYRLIQNHIGGGAAPAEGDFVPPPPNAMHDCLDALFAYLGDRGKDTPLLVEAAWLHYQFEAIHPYLDGNGRVGRLLIPLRLAERGGLDHPLLYLSPYFERNDRQYRELLFTVSTRSSWTQWLRFFLEGIKEQARSAVRLAERIIELGAIWRDRLHDRSAPPNAYLLADHVLQHMAIDANAARRVLQVTPPTAYNLIAALENAGILQEVTGRPRDRLYVAGELLDLVENAD